jgi:predicted GIY-YIG superfamily endonuclease
MNYTLDRFSREDRDLVSLVKDTFEVATLSGSLGRLLEADTNRRAKDSNAKRAMLSFMRMANMAQPEEEVGPDLFAKFLGKALKWVGKKVLKNIVKPILRFAGRMAMSVIRFAGQALLRYILIPIIEFVAAVAVANPITAAVVGIAALVGGGYLAWKKWFRKPEVQDEAVANAPQEVDTANTAQAATDVQSAGQATVEGQESVQSQVYEKSITDYVSAPIEKVKEFVSGKKPKAGKFTGFGEDVDGYIKETAAMFPILPIDVLRGFIKMEAGWTGAMSPTGAIGTGQFIQSTWDALARTAEGQRIGMTVIGSRFRTAQDPRFNKRINTLATGLLASKNAAMLQARGLPITGENLYMMHNIGPGIIPVMLGQAASDKTLLAMRQNGMTANMTASQFLEFQKGRFRANYEEANRATSMVADQPQMAKGIAIEAEQESKTAATTAKKGTVVAAAQPPSQNLIRGPGRTIVRA